MGRWNLELGTLGPALTLLGRHDELVELDLPRFDVGDDEGGAALRRGVPAKRVGDLLVTTVFDLFAAQLGVDATACRASGRPATTTRSPTRPPGRRRSPASTPAASSASRASSPGTRSAPRGAR